MLWQTFFIPIRTIRFLSWTLRHRTFACRFCFMYKKALNVCMTVLHVCKKALKLVHGDFARVQKGIEVGSWGVCRCTKGYWSWFKGFCTCTKRHWSWFKGGLHVYKRALNDVKMVLYSEQFGHEVTSSRFYVVYMTMTKITSQIICLFSTLLYR